jgi:branched-chain amino acid transport system substrate-binding protein
MKTWTRFVMVCLVLTAGLLAGCSSEVKIGAIVSRTGGTSPYGQEVAKGLDLALEEINAAGGVLGSPLVLIYRDDKSSPEAGVAAAEDLIQNEGVRLIIGPVSSSVTKVVAEVAQKNSVVLLSPSASAPVLSTAGDYIFRNYPSDIIEGTAMAEFAKANGVRKVVIFAMEEEFGRGLNEVFRRRFESKSRKVLETFYFPPDASDDVFAPMIEEVRELEPQGVYIIAYVDQMATLLKQLDEAGCAALKMGSGAVTEDTLALAGDAADNLIYAKPKLDIESKDPKVASFVKAYTEKYGTPPDVFAAHAYDALHAMVMAIEEAQMSHPDSVKLQLLNLDFQGAAGKTAFDERGDVTRYPQIFVLHEGESILFDKFEEAGGKLPVPGS